MRSFLESVLLQKELSSCVEGLEVELKGDGASSDEVGVLLQEGVEFAVAVLGVDADITEELS